MAAGHPGGDGAAVASRVTAIADPKAAGLPPGHRAAGSAGSTPRAWPGWPTGPRSGRPSLGGRRLTSRIAALLERSGPWTLPRIHHYLGRPQVSPRTLYRRVRLVAVWWRPKLTARGDPDHDHVVARLIELPRRLVVLAEDETHLNLLPHVRAAARRPVAGAHPRHEPQGHRARRARGDHGAWVYRLSRRCAADFTALLDQAAPGFPVRPGDRDDLAQWQHPSRPQGHRLPG